eukprot:1270886-Rhodomonas_salina.1
MALSTSQSGLSAPGSGSAWRSSAASYFSMKAWLRQSTETSCQMFHDCWSKPTTPPFRLSMRPIRTWRDFFFRSSRTSPHWVIF